MTLAENDIATRLRQIANKEDFDNTVAWIDSYPTIEWTTNDAEPDIIKALVLNIIFTGNSQDQKCLLAVLLKKKLVLDSDKIKS